MHVEKPLLGFGPMGWALLAVAGALVVVWVTGYDLQYQLLKVIYIMSGESGLRWFHIHIWIWLNLSVFNTSPAGMYGVNVAHFGLWGMCATLIAFQVYPKRIRAHWWIAIFVWGLATAPLMYALMPYFRDLLGNSTLPNYGGQLFITELCLLFVLLFLVWFSTRSKRVILGITILGVCSPIILDHVLNILKMNSFPMMLTGSNTLIHSRPEWLQKLLQAYVWAWNPLLLAILLSWAIPARIRYIRYWLCFECGYNMRNLKNNTCPECGVINERAPVALPATSASP